MQARTAFRLAMLANGYVPVLNDCKKSVEPGWPRKHVDEGEVLSWDRSIYASTGIRIERGLAVIDVDSPRPDLNDALAARFAVEFPGFFQDALVRHSAGHKEAWFARTEEPFRRYASRLWIARGASADDPAAAKHQVESFGGASTRQFGVDGPHARNPDGTVRSTYSFEDGASPATVPRSELPVLPQAAFGAACDLFDRLAAGAGLVEVKRAPGATGRGDYAFVLLPDTAIELEDGTMTTVADLSRWVRQRNHAGYLRCSGSFHDPSRVRPDSHAVTWGRYGLTIHDFMTETNFVEACRKPPEAVDLAALGRQLREGGRDARW